MSLKKTASGHIELHLRIKMNLTGLWELRWLEVQCTWIAQAPTLNQEEL